MVIEPDGRMFEHARAGFGDLRVLDANGAQVPWRTLPPSAGAGVESVQVLNSGRQGRFAAALLDLGPKRAVRDRVTLDVPDTGFVGRAVVLGADRREGPFTQLSATGIYDVGGARRARSTTAVFPPSDFRYLQIRASGVSRIDGATVSGEAGRPPVVRRVAKRIATRRSGTRTLVTLDFDARNVPVDELRISARTARYDRPVTVEASNTGERWAIVAEGRISRFEGSSPGPISVGTRARYVRVTIENGNDPPLAVIRVAATSRSHALVLEGGHARPYRLYYGGPTVRAPSYEFARIPFDPERATVRGTLGAEERNALFAPPPDTRSFLERHDWVAQAALALAALALGGIGLLVVLRSRA